MKDKGNSSHWSLKLRYEFDNLMMRGTVSQIVGLLVLSLLLSVIGGILLAVFRLVPADETGNNLGSILRNLWLHSLDPAALAESNGSLTFLFIMFLITLSGLFVLSALIGILSTGLDRTLEELQKGRSFVAEQNHTVILGASPKIFHIISELLVANENLRRAGIVVLADEDPVALLNDIQDRIGHTGNTRLVVRSGNPLDTSDLKMVNLNDAKAIIIPSPEEDDPDVWVIKVILAILNNKGQRTQPYHIVAEIKEQKQADVVNMIGRDEVKIVLTHTLISRLTAQSSRHSGLSEVYTELFDFAGDEIYFQEEQTLVDQPFSQALLQYEDSALLGLFTQKGEVLVNPAMDRLIKPGDQVIAISKDDDTVRISANGRPQINEHLFGRFEPNTAKPKKERTLILGWNNKITTIIRELDQYVTQGSELLIVADKEDGQAIIDDECTAAKNQQLLFRQEDTTDRQVLDSLDIPRFDQVIVLSYSDDLNAQKADAKTLITLLHLRDIADKSDNPFRIVSEMLDLRNKELAQVTRADDFIVGDNLISLILTQVAENPHLGQLFEKLSSAAGSEFYLKPAADYIQLEQEIDFYTVVHSASRRGEVAVGYRAATQAHTREHNFGVVLNPIKSVKRKYSAADQIIVLAES